jgi:hypothetical protein
MIRACPPVAQATAFPRNTRHAVSGSGDSVFRAFAPGNHPRGAHGVIPGQKYDDGSRRRDRNTMCYGDSAPYAQADPRAEPPL